MVFTMLSGHADSHTHSLTDGHTRKQNASGTDRDRDTERQTDLIVAVLSIASFAC